MKKEENMAYPKTILIGDRVKTPSGLIGTVIDILGSTCEVELDAGGLMHYNVKALKKI